MKNRNQRVRELMEVIIAASCEAKCLTIEGAIAPEIETMLDQAAKDLKTHVIVTKETQTPLWLKALGVR